ncbi:gluconokinase [Corynebacterium pelargi]|uniref:gluconokinase n=1 Tax=Corynebacterium pelargi TaxID=1471400 RepID=UPI0010091D36|nr:gluconokinase [Corynebacterium pelargi]GGG72814.1 gluconokinase [Corynebacterium pelargi]
MHIILMGVSGSGKTTVGTLLAQRLNMTYRDGDDLHPQANVEKMAAGIPLNDEDRWPWLQRVGDWLAEHNGIMACSALKRSYRDYIREYAPTAVFVHVHGSRELLASRMAARKGHFMPVSLLDSQLATLEPLEDDEPGAVFSIEPTPEEIVEAIVEWLEAKA